jgi:hypothetical protein
MSERADRIQDPRMRRAFYALEDALSKVEVDHSLAPDESVGLVAEVLTLKFAALVGSVVIRAGGDRQRTQQAVLTASRAIVGAVRVIEDDLGVKAAPIQ